MAYANSHVKVTIFGESFGAAEEWSTGFRMGDEDGGGGNFGIPAGFTDALLPLWSTFFTTAGNYFHSNWTTVGIKASLILTTGKTDLNEIQTSTYPTPITGGSNGPVFPPQISLVAQLAAANPRQLGGKGRMYLPGTVAPVNGTGHIENAAAQAIANGLRTFLDGAESVANSPGFIINASKGRVGVPFAPPVNKRVATVRVGNVYDTQRRRRNQLTETYSSAALAA